MASGFVTIVQAKGFGLRKQPDCTCIRVSEWETGRLRPLEEAGGGPSGAVRAVGALPTGVREGLPPRGSPQGRTPERKGAGELTRDAWLPPCSQIPQPVTFLGPR